jgi:hypothetical protein
MVQRLMASASNLSLRSKRAPIDDDDRRNYRAAKDDDEKCESDDESDDDDKKKEDDKDSRKSKKAKKAESDDDDEDDDKKDKDDKKSHARVRRIQPAASFQDQFMSVGPEAEDDDDGDHIDAGNPLASAARARERGKMKAILASPAGKAAFDANPKKTMRFLSTYSGSRADAIATLELLAPDDDDNKPAARKDPLRERMQTEAVPSVGPTSHGSEAPTGQDAAIALIVKADKMRRGETVEG